MIALKNARINFQPANATGYEGDYHSFEVYATGEGLAFQWQVEKGNGFEDLDENETFLGTKSAILSIPALTQKMDGHQFRCIVSGNSCEAATLVSDAASLTVGTNLNQQKAMMPGNPSNVVWYMDGMTQPVFFNGNPMVYVDGAVKVTNNSQLTSQVGTGASCEIKMTGHLYNNNATSPLLTPGDVSQFTFIGGDAQEIIGGDTAKNNFYKLRIDKTSNTDALKLNNDISIRKNLELAKGDLDLNGKKTLLKFVNGSFVPQTLATNNAVDFPVIINESETNRIIGTTAGSLVFIKNQLVANTSPFIAGFNPGNIGTTIKDPTNHFAAKKIDIDRAHLPFANGGSNSIGRTYKIASNPDTPVPVNMEFTFHYLDADLADPTESWMKIFKSDNNGTTWVAQQTDVLDAAANTAKQNDVADITTLWTLFQCLDVPVVTFTEGTEKHLCEGQVYTFTPANSGGAATSYSWTLNGVPVATTPTYTMTGVSGTPPQSLVFTAFNTIGCSTSDQITVIHEPSIAVYLGPDTAVCMNHSINYTANVAGIWSVDGIVQGNPQVPVSTFTSAVMPGMMGMASPSCALLVCTRTR